MPRTLTFPAPSSTECPICSAPLPGVRCDACGARFDGPDGTTLWRVDHDLHDLSVVRNEVVARLLTEAAWTERAVAAPAPTAPAAPAEGHRMPEALSTSDHLPVCESISTRMAGLSSSRVSA